MYVAPNLHGESFGIVLLEAMAAGAPIVASDLDAFARVLDGGRCGLLFPAGDAAALARTVEDLLGSADRRAALSAAGSAEAAATTGRSVARRVLDVYEAVLETRLPEPDERSGPS